MLMSIFSSFDAFCAESISQKVGLSRAPAKVEKEASAVNKKEVSPSVEGLNKGKQVISSSSPSEVKKTSRQERPRRQRFAPELDGVYCFETIIPY